jgi:hypothetical protein
VQLYICATPLYCWVESGSAGPSLQKQIAGKSGKKIAYRILLIRAYTCKTPSLNIYDPFISG